MKTKRSDLLTVILFTLFLALMLLGYLLLPKREFSQQEKRYLAQPPKLSWDALASGEWGDDVENYMADHIPGRDVFVGLNAYFELFTGRQAGKDIQVLGDRLVEAPVQENPAAVAKNMEAINRFASALGRPVDLMIVPSAGWAAGGEGYRDSALIADIAAAAGEGVRPVSLEAVFEGRPELFFKTDHHWNSLGAHSAYAAYMTAAGREFVPAEDFGKAVCAQFQGSTYSRSALWLTPAEDLELWTGPGVCSVTNGESEGVHQGVYYPERLEEADKYTVFLDGNHSIVRVHNPAGQGKLLVVRDSFSNSLGCFLAQSYEDVVLVDLRYYRSSVSLLVEQEAFDDILVCYSIGNFMTDTNIVWLR